MLLVSQQKNLKCYFVSSRVALHIGITENIFGVRDKHVALPEIKTLVPYTNAGGGFFFSSGYSISNWSYTLGNHTLVLKNDPEFITSFHLVSPYKLITHSKSSVSHYLRMPDNEIFTLTKRLICNQQEKDRLTLNNCARTTTSHLGPIAVDYHKSVIYYTNGSTVQRVLNISAPNLPTPIELDESLGDVTAMAFNKDYSYLFTIQNRDLTQTIRMYDLASLEQTRSLQLVEYHNKILQAVPLGDGIILCRNSDKYLVLLNTYSGQFSRVSEGITHLPCDSIQCGQNPILVHDLASNNHFQGREVVLYGVDESKRPIALPHKSKYSLRLIVGASFIGNPCVGYSK